MNAPATAAPTAIALDGTVLGPGDAAPEAAFIPSRGFWGHVGHRLVRDPVARAAGALILVGVAARPLFNHALDH